MSLEGDKDVQIAVLAAQFAAHQASTEAFRDEVRQALSGITDRLDVKINGRLDKQAELLSEHARIIAGQSEKVRNLVHEVFSKTAKAAAVAEPKTGAITLTISPDAKTLSAIFGALVLVGLSIWKAGAL